MEMKLVVIMRAAGGVAGPRYEWMLQVHETVHITCM